LPALPSPPPPPSTPALSSAQKAQLTQARQTELALPQLEDEVTPESAKRSEIHRRLKQYAKDNPRETTQLIRSWILEDTYGAKE
jgi:flagellar biosynthesis/type III secretory pathway M-ring protein FliF/YscJ